MATKRTTKKAETMAAKKAAIGEGRYIHSTGASASGGVVINSLDPADPLYREDLVKSLYAVGSVF